jgi:disulfide bond formation protein DsbB
MLVGLAVFVVPKSLGRLLILSTAFLCGSAMIYLNRNEVIYALGPNALVAICLIGAGFIGYLALGKAGLPDWAGQPSDPEKLNQTLFLGLKTSTVVYLGSLISVPIFALLV